MSNSTSRNGSRGSGKRSSFAGSGALGDPRIVGFRPHRALWVQALVAAWRWSVELLLLAALLYALHYADTDLGVSATVVVLVLAVLLVALTVYPPSRRVLGSVFWVMVTRHRLRTFFVEARVFNRSGKLPWVLTCRPTPVGERCWVWLMPGLSVEDFTNAVEKIATATWARTARVARHHRNGSLVRIDVIRRDPLTSGGSLPSVLIPATGNGATDQDTAAGAGVLDLPRPVINLRDLGVTIPKNPGSSRASKGGGTTTPATAAQAGPLGPVVSAAEKADGVSPWSRSASAGPVSRGNGEDVSDYV